MASQGYHRRTRSARQGGNPLNREGHAGQRLRPPAWAVLAGYLACGNLLDGARAGQQETPPQPAHSGEAEGADVRERARALLERSATDVGARQEAFAALTSGAPVALPLLGAISRSHTPPPEFVPVLAELLDDPDPAYALGALDALSAYHSRAAVRPLVERLVSEETEAGRREHLASALVQQTGRDDLGADPEAWARWWQTAQFLSESEWISQIAASQARRARALAEENADARDRVVELYRRLHRRTDEAERPPLLSQMLASPQPGVRDLGLELTTRRLLNARPIDDQVVGALVSLIGDPSPERRAAAARILSRLGRADGSARITAALTTETDPLAADALLRAGAVRPDPSQVAAAVRWLESETVARSAAAALLASAIEAGVAVSPAQAERIDGFLESLPDDRVREEVVDLLAALGRRGRLLGLLSASDRMVAQRAGAALARNADEVGELVAAGRRFDDLARVAVRAIEQHRPDADGLLLALSVWNSSDERLLEQIAQIARALPPWRLMGVALRIESLERRAALLGSVLDRQYVSRPGEEPMRARLVMLAARTELALGESDRALRRLESLPPSWDGAGVQLLRIEALARDGRTQDAIELTESALGSGAAPTHHIGAIEDQAQARAIVEQLRERFGSMIGEQFDRIVGLGDQQSAAAGDPGVRDDSPDS